MIAILKREKKIAIRGRNDSESCVGVHIRARGDFIKRWNCSWKTKDFGS